MTGPAVTAFGATFIGQFVNSILMGVTTIQAWNYYWNYRSRDPQTLKVFIAILVGMDAFHSVICFYMFYWYLVLNFGNLDNAQFNIWAFNIQGAVADSMSFLVQLTFARRVYILSNKITFPALIAGAASLNLVVGFVDCTKEFAVKRFSRYGSFTWLACLGLGAMLTADVLIALSMCWYLYHKRTGIARSDSVIMVLMSYSISSGLMTSVIAVGTVSAEVIKPSSLITAAFFWTWSKFHVNSLIAMLNTRNSILEWSANLHPQTTFRVGSLITQQQKEPTHELTFRPTATSVNMPQTTTTDSATTQAQL